MKEEMFLLQFCKRDKSIINIAIYDEESDSYIDDSGTVCKTHQPELYDYEYMTFRDMRVNLNACNFLKGGKL